jgi:hypothetical protein
VLKAMLALPAIALGQGRGPISVDLSATGPGGQPADFTFWHNGEGEAGQWTIIADPTAANGRAVAQLSHDPTDYRFPLAIYKSFSGKDLEASLCFKPVAGPVDEAGGIAVRLLTPDDYYVAGANAREDIVGLYRVVKGQHERLASANAKVASNQWHTLALDAEGNRFTVSFDGKVLFSAKDEALPAAGKVALWTEALLRHDLDHSPEVNSDRRAHAIHHQAACL